MTRNSLLDEIAAIKPYRPACTFGAFLATLTKAKVDEIREALASPHPSSAIHAALTRRHDNVPRIDTLRRHRKAECGCE
jgi:hypothetical protein